MYYLLHFINMREFIYKNKILIILWILCGIALFVFCGHYGNILLDIGREIYYPERILQGKALYKDLFNIYGPFSYLWNALLYKIFSPNLGTLYFSGAICSLAIVSGVYIIAKRFLTEILSFMLAIFAIVSGVCAPHLFNYTLPYSYAMLYGTVAFVYSLLSLLKYCDTKKTYYFYISAILAGICISNKYDFILYGLLLLTISIFTRNKKFILNFITCIIIVPVFCALILLIQGVTLDDYVKVIQDISSVVSSKTLAYFYTVQGVFFQKKIFAVWGINILKTISSFGLIAIGIKLLDKNKILGWIVTILSAGLLYFITSPLIFVFLIPLTIVIACAFAGKLKDNLTIIYFLLAVLSVSTKSFWALIPLNYGNYIMPFVIIAFLVIIFTIFNQKYDKVFVIGLIVISLNMLVEFSYSRLIFNHKISTSKGIIYSSLKNARTTNELISGLNGSNINSVVVFPEGLIINFMTGIKSNDYFNSMLPLYVESMNEQRIINNIREMSPEIIILTNTNMREYGVEYICDNYAFNFRDFVDNNYTNMDDIASEDFHYMVFVRKNIKEKE